MVDGLLGIAFILFLIIAFTAGVRFFRDFFGKASNFSERLGYFIKADSDFAKPQRDIN